MIHNNEPNPKCPYCGYIERNAWEINFGACLDGDAEITCKHCSEDYVCQREVSVTYSTDKAAIKAEKE
jgi:hypothetical protein